MIGTDTHRRTIFLTDLHQRSETLANTVDLFDVFRIRIFYKLEFLFVDIVAGIYPHFLYDPGGNFRGIRRKVYVRYQRGLISPAMELVFYIQEIFGLFL